MIKTFAFSFLAFGIGLVSSAAFAEPAVERLKTRSGETVELALKSMKA